MKSFAVLFVCAGNICRSPLAEGVFRHLAEQRGLQKHFRIESCGTGAWHAGEKAHSESRRTAARHGISLEAHCARQLRRSDFEEFDLILAMDRENLAVLERYGRGKTARLSLMRGYDPLPGDGEVPDPFYGPADGFEEVFEMLERSCRALLDEFEKMLAEAAPA